MRQLTAIVLVCSAVVLLPVIAVGQESAGPWQPVAPEGLPEDYDWIRLSSGEWLKGEVIAMFDDDFEFESDELGVLKFDFDDVQEIRTARVVQVGFQGRESVVGRLTMVGGTVRVIGDGGEVEFDRGTILSLIVGTPRERNYWSGYVNLGGNVRSGNTEQIDYTARFGAMRRTVNNRMTFDYVGSITRIDSEDTSNNHRANVGWDRFVSRRLFVKLASVEWYRDRFQNIANRWTLGAGLGYEIIDTSRTTWSVNGGPAWQSTAWDSVEAGDDDTSGSLALHVGTGLELEITNSIDYYASYDALFTEQESGTYSHHVDTGLEIELIGDLDFNISWIWDHIRDPRPLEDGTVPEQNDTRLVFGLGWSF